MIALTIDGREVRLDGPATVLEAARGAGIRIPTLCHLEGVESFGGCRLCLVEVEKMPKLQTACTLQAAQGMVVRTDTEAVRSARRSMLELLLANHPLDCPACDKAGECELQDLAARYGPSAGRFSEAKRRAPAVHDDPLIVRNPERCVLCTRCVRVCEARGAGALSVMSRGGKSTVEPFSGKGFSCEYCGDCVAACPTGALLSRRCLHAYRPWSLDRETTTVCPYCGTGCAFVAQARDGEVRRVASRPGLGPNGSGLCVRGRFGYGFAASRDRLKAPLLRKDGRLQEVSWEEALSFAASRLSAVRAERGPGAVAGIASPRCTNEDNFAFQRLLREACGTDNVDSVSRLGFAAAQARLEALLGPGAASHSIAALEGCDAILVLGGDPTAVNPVLGKAVRRASRRGARLVVLGGAPGLERFKPLRIAPPLFGEAALLEAALAGLSGAQAGSAPEAARLAEALRGARRAAVVLGMDVVQRGDGHRALAAVAGLVRLLRGPLYLLCERANEQGLLDMGCAPRTGLTLLEMLEGARRGEVRALYVMGANPAFDVPGGAAAVRALESLDLLVVQDLFLTETARLAHVVLPAAAWSERQGTFTNLERRVQLLGKAVEPRAGMEDWRILAEVSARMGRPMEYRRAEDVFRDICRTVPAYRGLSYAGLASGGRFAVPAAAEPVPRAEPTLPPAQPAKSEGACFLSVDRPLFHSGSLSRRAPALQAVAPEPKVRLAPGLARSLGLASGDRALLKAGAGSVLAVVSVEEGLEEGRAFLGNNFEGRGALSLFDSRMDPLTKAPALEGLRVVVEKAP